MLAAGSMFAMSMIAAYSDGWWYWSLARYLSGDGYRWETSLRYGATALPSLVYPPGYPALLAGLHALCGSGFGLALLVVQHGCVLAGAWTAWTMAGLAGLKRARWIAPAVFLGCPEPWIYAHDVMSDVLVFALLALGWAAVAALDGEQRPGTRTGVVAGVAMGVLLLTRTIAAAALAPAVIIVWSVRPRARRALAAAATTAVLLALPWVAHNWHVAGVIGLSNGTGRHLFDRMGEDGLAPVPGPEEAQLNRANGLPADAPVAGPWWRYFPGLMRAGLDETRADAVLRGVAVRGLLAHPVAYLATTLVRAPRLLVWASDGWRTREDMPAMAGRDVHIFPENVRTYAAWMHGSPFTLEDFLVLLDPLEPWVWFHPANRWLSAWHRAWVGMGDVLGPLALLLMAAGAIRTWGMGWMARGMLLGTVAYLLVCAGGEMAMQRYGLLAYPQAFVLAVTGGAWAVEGLAGVRKRLRNAPGSAVRRPRVVRLAPALAGGALVMAATAGALAYRWSASPEFLARGDAVYDWNVARHLIRGEGFSTSLLPLFTVQDLAGRNLLGRDPWPSPFKFAGSQVRVAAFLLAFGDSARSVKLAAVVPYLALCLVVFVLLLGLGLPPLAAALAASAFSGFGRLADFSVAGLGYSGDALLFTVAAVAMARADAPRRGWVAGLVAGVTAALLVVHRYSFIVFAPLPAAFLCWRGGPRTPERRRAALAAAAGAATLLVPFMVHSWLDFGRLLPSGQGWALALQGTPYLPYEPWYLLDLPSVDAVLRADPGAFAAKVLRGAANLATGNPEPLVPFQFAVLLLAGWGVVRSGSRAAGWLAAFVAVQTAAQLPIQPGARYDLYAVPLVFVAAVHGWHDLLRRWWPARCKAVLLGSLAAAAVATQAVNVTTCRRLVQAGWRTDCRLQPDALCDRAEVAAWVNRSLPAGAVILGGDRPWDLAMDTRTRVLPLTPFVADVDRLERQGLVVDAIYIPADLGYSGDGRRLPSWLEWYCARDEDGGWLLPHFHRAHVFEDGGVVLVRRPGSAVRRTPDEPAILSRLTTRTVEFGTVRGSYHELSGFGPRGGGGVRLAATSAMPPARLGLHLPAGRGYRLIFTARGPRGCVLSVAAQGREAGAVAVTPEWRRWTVLLPASRDDGGWRTVELRGAGCELLRVEVEPTR